MENIDDSMNLRELEKEYCPPLDPALFTAIVCDFDLSDSSQVQQLRETLDTLKISAWEQEDLPFDPSGTSGLGNGNGQDVGDGILSERSTSQHETVRSRETDITSLASELESVSVSDKDRGLSYRSEEIRYTIGADGAVTLAGAGEDDKIGYLAEMFPSVDRFTIKHSLKKSEGDIDRAMDVLLNVAFFDEQPTDEDGAKLFVPKGIDGFGEGEVGRKKGKKKNNKKNKNKAQELSYPVESDANHVVNKWDIGQKDVDFIYSRTSPVLKKETVTSTYHANGASLSATIRSLATANATEEEHINDDPVMVTQVAELSQEFSTITPTVLAGLLNITRNSISAANELATEMVARPAPVPLSEVIQIKATPLALETGNETPKKRGKQSRVIRDYEIASSSAGANFSAGADAFSKASMAYRRGKSDRLMGGAAAYYSAVGRDHLERAKREASMAADALVDSQSTSTMLDLHGVSVQDGVRIASDRVAEWWESMGDAKYIRGGGNLARDGYRIVTGVGRHSHDGTSRLGPAVGKMLAREGWRVEVGMGVLTVVGIARRQ
ncbi:hypothetical protein MW887_003967 [Aspergillus wentii]|nr:hypothetical protein MW887_003967 [Aspergillus wentii]